MSTYNRNRKHYTVTVEQMGDVYVGIITNTITGATLMTAGFRYYRTALEVAQAEYDTLTK